MMSVEIDVISIAMEDLNRWDPQLVELVRENKINPWDIDIIYLTNKYLEKINEMRTLDFRIPGRAVLTAAILLKLKSDHLMEWKEKRTFIRQQQPHEGIPFVPDLRPLKREVERKITLLELVDALRGAFEVEKRKRMRNVRLKQIAKISTFDMTAMLEGLKAAIFSIFEKQPEIELIELQHHEEFPILFLGLLHLANDGFIDLLQDEWNSTVKIKKATGTEEETGMQAGSAVAA